METAPIAEQPGQTPPVETMPPEDMGGFVVCIAVAPDGQLSVGMEGGEMRPAEDRKDALTQALELLKSEGKAGEDTAEAEFSAGYQARSGMPG